MPDDLAWEPITDYERWWTPFDDRFAFRASVDPDGWPGITEPVGSVTFSLEPICGTGSEPVTSPGPMRSTPRCSAPS